MSDNFPNVQLAKTCAIRKVEYPKGTVHAKQDIPKNQLKLWLEFGLAFETEAPTTKKVAEGAKRDLAIAKKKSEDAELRQLEKQIAKEEAAEKKKADAKKKLAEKKAKVKAKKVEAEAKAEDEKKDPVKDPVADTGNKPVDAKE